MKNNFNLLVKELGESNISIFMHRLETSHALYFNTKYKRSGPLFSGRFKAVHVENDIQYTHTSRYIHLNTLKIFDPMWKERGYVEDKVGAEKFLRDYKWSSLPEYLETREEFAPIIEKGPVIECFDNNSEEYWKFLTDWTNADKSTALVKN